MASTDGTIDNPTRRVRPLMRRVPGGHVRLAATPSPLPVQGSASGWIVRRDQALAALTGAGLTIPVVATLTVGCVRLGSTEVVIRLPGSGEEVSVARCADGLSVCGACAVHRWVHALELTVRHADPWVIPAILSRAPALTASPGHECLAARSIEPATATMTLLPTIDQWGPVPTRPSGPAPDPVIGVVPRRPNREARPGYAFPGP